MKKVYILGLLCLLSGILSAALFSFGILGELTLWVLPGLIFGLTGAIYALVFVERTFYRIFLAILWIAASTGSYYVAVYLAVSVVSSEVVSNFYYVFFAAGISGGFLMLVSWYIFIQRFQIKFFPILVGLAGILGLVPMLFPDPINTNAPLEALFVVWQ